MFNILSRMIHFPLKLMSLIDGFSKAALKTELMFLGTEKIQTVIMWLLD